MPHLVLEWIWGTLIRAYKLWEIGIKEGEKTSEQNKSLCL